MGVRKQSKIDVCDVEDAAGRVALVALALSQCLPDKWS
jgi:hypothetical protein